MHPKCTQNSCRILHYFIVWENKFCRKKNDSQLMAMLHFVVNMLNLECQMFIWKQHLKAQWINIHTYPSTDLGLFHDSVTVQII